MGVVPSHILFTLFLSTGLFLFPCHSVATPSDHNTPNSQSLENTGSDSKTDRDAAEPKSSGELMGQALKDYFKGLEEKKNSDDTEDAEQDPENNKISKFLDGLLDDSKESKEFLEKLAESLEGITVEDLRDRKVLANIFLQQLRGDIASLESRISNSKGPLSEDISQEITQLLTSYQGFVAEINLSNETLGPLPNVAPETALADSSPVGNGSEIVGPTHSKEKDSSNETPTNNAGHENNSFSNRLQFSNPTVKSNFQPRVASTGGSGVTQPPITSSSNRQAPISSRSNTTSKISPIQPSADATAQFDAAIEPIENSNESEANNLAQVNVPESAYNPPPKVVLRQDTINLAPQQSGKSSINTFDANSPVTAIGARNQIAPSNSEPSVSIPNGVRTIFNDSKEFFDSVGNQTEPAITLGSTPESRDFPEVGERAFNDAYSSLAARIGTPLLDTSKKTPAKIDPPESADAGTASSKLAKPDLKDTDSANRKLASTETTVQSKPNNTATTTTTTTAKNESFLDYVNNAITKLKETFFEPASVDVTPTLVANNSPIIETGENDTSNIDKDGEQFALSDPTPAGSSALKETIGKWFNN